MRKVICITAAAIAAFFMLPFFDAAAYAMGIDIPPGDEPAFRFPPVVEDPVIRFPATAEEPPSDPVTDYPERNPFTPSGTGTVVDTATDGDGKEFYTVVTPDEHVFYIVIDKQRGQENVYFLNTVTVADLAALAEVPEADPAAGPTSAPAEQPTAESTPTPTPAPVPEKEQGGGNTVMYVSIAVLAALGGGAGWYFKIYRPKQSAADDGGEYEPPANVAEYGDWDDEPDVADGGDDSPPWDEDDDTSDGGGGSESENEDDSGSENESEADE